METDNFRVIIHILCIFGWFWMMAWTIVRVGFFKKRVFSMLLFIYFSKAVTLVSELIASDFSLVCPLWGSQLSNLSGIIGFYLITSLLLNYKSKYYEKNNLNPDS